MERYDHIDIEWCLVSIDIAQLKPELIIVVLLRRLVALVYDISLEVKSNHIHLKSHHLCEIVIHNKCKIGLTAAKINYIELPDLEI